MLNSARKGGLVREQDLGVEEGCGEAGCCPGTGRILRVARSPGCPKLWSPGAGTPVGARAWMGGIPVLRITRITPKKKRDSSQIGVLGTSAPAHSGASWHLQAPPRGCKCLSPVRWPQWSRWELRALVKWQSCESALGGHGKELGRQRPSAPRTWQEHSSSGLSKLGPAGWVASCLAPWFLPARHPTHPPIPCVVSAWPLAEPNCFWWRVTHMRPQQLAIPRPASTLLAVMDPWAPRAGAPPPNAISCVDHCRTTPLSWRQVNKRVGNLVLPQANNKITGEACLHTRYPEPDCPRTSHRAQAATLLSFCVFLFCLHRRTVGKKNNAAQEKTKGRPQSLLLIFFLLEVWACPDVLSKVIHSQNKNADSSPGKWDYTCRRRFVTALPPSRWLGIVDVSDFI